MKKSNNGKNNAPKPRGFAAMSPETRSRICSMGGKACMQIKGHAARIGKLGGQNSHRGDSARRKLVVAKRKG